MDFAAAADVVLALVGEEWSRAADPSGKRCLEDPADVVRLELETALRRGIPVIPVLIGPALLPSVEQLPLPLRVLTVLETMPLRPDPYFNWDVSQLIQKLDQVPTRATASAVPQTGSPVSESVSAAASSASAESNASAETTSAPESAQAVANFGSGNSGRSSSSRLQGLDEVVRKTMMLASSSLSEARRLVEHEQDFAQALELLEQSPEQLRDMVFYEQVKKQWAEVTRLEKEIVDSVSAMQLTGLYVKVEELLALQPKREDLRQLLSTLPRPASARPSAAPAAPAGGNPRPRSEGRPGPEARRGGKAAAPAAAAPQTADSGKTFLENAIGMRFVLVPAGEFRMGSPESEQDRERNEGPTHLVRLSRPYLLGIQQVTQGQFEKVLGFNPSFFHSHGKGSMYVGGQDTSKFPVEQVSWFDAVEFCQELSEWPEEKAAGRSYRLPTEAEWEHAARAGTEGPFAFGETLTSQQANFNGNYPYGPYGHMPRGAFLEKTIRVGSFMPNAYGLHDMHGNVWEWCADWFDAEYYKVSPNTDPTGPAQGIAKVIRGGGWNSPGHKLRSAQRHGSTPNNRYRDDGFRVVCVVAGK